MRGMNSVLDILKGLRAAGLSQSEIARRTGIPQPRLSRWEAGEVPASADDALQLQRLQQSIAALGAPAQGQHPQAA